MKNLSSKKDNIYSKILGMNNKTNVSLFSLKFNDPKIEIEFRKLILKQNLIYKIIIHILYLGLILLRLFSAKINEYPAVRNSNIVFLLIWIILQILFYSNKIVNVKIYLDILISFCFVSMQMVNAILSNFFLSTDFGIFQLRTVYIMIIFSMIEILLSIDYSFFLCLSYFLINSAVCIAIPIYIDDGSKRYVETIIAVSFICIMIYFKIKTCIITRENFIQKYKFRRYFSYCYDLINSMNGFQFSRKNNKILFFNKSFKNHLLNIVKNTNSFLSKSNEKIENSKDFHKINNDNLKEKKNLRDKIIFKTKENIKKKKDSIEFNFNPKENITKIKRNSSDNITNKNKINFISSIHSKQIYFLLFFIF